jgi:hypothetical protein
MVIYPASMMVFSDPEAILDDSFAPVSDVENIMNKIFRKFKRATEIKISTPVNPNFINCGRHYFDIRGITC